MYLLPTHRMMSTSIRIASFSRPRSMSARTAAQCRTAKYNRLASSEFGSPGSSLTNASNCSTGRCSFSHFRRRRISTISRIKRATFSSDGELDS